MTNEKPVIDIRRQEKYVPLQQLPLSNGFIFGEAMYDVEASKAVLEIILGKEISRVELVNKEQHLDIDGIHKGVRLDIYVKDDEDCIYCTLVNDVTPTFQK